MPPTGALSLFGQTVPTGTYAPADPHDTQRYTMGVEFDVTAPAEIYGVWFLSSSWATSLPGDISLWTVTGASTGTLVRTDAATWSGALGSGWVYAPFASPVALTAGTRYKASVTDGTTGDWYSSTHLYWDTGTAGSPGGSGITNGILSAPGSSAATGGVQGTYFGGSVTPTYPTTTYQNSNYWVDVAVAPTMTVTAGESSASEVALQVLVLTGATEAGGASAPWYGTTDSFTPGFTNSFIAWCQSNFSNATIPTIAASNTYYSDIAGSLSNTYGFGSYSGAVTAGTAVTIGTTGGTSEGAGYEIRASAAATPAIDASTPALANPYRTNTATTASFAPPPGSVLVAMLSAYDTAATVSPTITDSSGLVWTQRAVENQFNSALAVVWTATVPATGVRLVQSAALAPNQNWTSVTATLANVAAGDTLVWALSYTGNATEPQPFPTMSDSSGNTWEIATVAGQNPPWVDYAAVNQVSFIAWATNVKASSSLVVTMAYATSQIVEGFGSLSEWSGAGSVSAGVSASGTAGTTALPSMTVPTGGAVVGTMMQQYANSGAVVPPFIELDAGNGSAYALPSAGAFAGQWTNPNARNWNVAGIVLAPAAGGTAHAGASALSGTGILSGTGTKLVPGAALLAGSGTLTGSGTRSGTHAGAAVLAGSGTLSGTAHKTVPGGAVLAGSGTLSGTGQKAVPGAAALAGSGTLAGTGTKLVPGAAALTGGGILNGTGTKAVPGAAVLTAAGAVAATGTVHSPGGVQGSALLRAVPALTANPVLALDPQDAWRAYLAAYAKAQAAGYNWRMMRTAGGTDGTAGFLYGQFYELDRQADLAYEAYLAAQKAAHPGTAG